MNVMALVKKIEDLGLGEQGKTLFVSEMPSDCPAGILLRLPLTGIPIDHELPNYYRGSVQMIVRATKHAQGEPLADQLRRAFTLQNIDLLDASGKGMRLKRMLPRTLPIVYRRSDGNGIEWSINFDIVYTAIE